MPSAEKRERKLNIPVPPKAWDELTSDAQALLEDFNLFRTEVFLRDPVPWATDAANRTVEWLLEPDDVFGVMSEPPGSGKSTLFTHDLVCWLLCGGGTLDPAFGRSLRIMIGSHALNVSTDYVRRIRATLEDPSPFYNRDRREMGKISLVDTFGRFKPESSHGDEIMWSSERILVAQVGGRVYEKEPTVFAAAIKARYIGQRANLCIWDDPVDPKSLRLQTPERSQEIAEDFEDEAESRCEPGGCFLVVGQRLGPNDLYRSRMDATYPNEDGDEVPKYRQIVYPAHNEATCENGGKLGPKCRQWDAKEDGCLLDAKRLGWKRLLMKAAQGNFRCTPAETPILMADWTDKPISQIKEGEWVMGFEGRVNHLGHTRYYRVPTQVQKVHEIGVEPVATITLESGHRMRSTPDHPWFSMGGKGGKRGYWPARVGRRLSVFDKPVYLNPEEMADWAYLAGIMDGEGHIPHKSKAGNCVSIAQCKDKNPEVFAAIQSTLDRLGVDYHLYPPANGRTGYIFQIRGGRSFIRNLLHVPQFGKREQARAWLHRRGASMTGRATKVESVEVDGDEPVYALTTGTENYFAWGVPCHNTVYQQEDANPEDLLVQPAWIYGGVDMDGFDAPGCLDEERDFWEWPKGNVITYACVDPSATNWWATEVKAFNPDTNYRYLIYGERRKMRAGLENGFLDYNPETQQHVGLMETLQQKSGELGNPIQVWIVEQNAAHRYLFQTFAYKLWRQKWPHVIVVPHQTQKNKNDEEFGVDAALGMVYRQGLTRLPYAKSVHLRNYVGAKIKELTNYPQYPTDDTVMCDWFGEFQLPRVMDSAKRMKRMGMGKADPTMPTYVQRRSLPPAMQRG